MTYRLFAFGHDKTMYVYPSTFSDMDHAFETWRKHDDARRAGRRPHVRWYALREDGHQYGDNAVESSIPFYDAQNDGDTLLTDSECAVIMDSLAAMRNRLSEMGVPTPNVESALAKIQRGYQPSTAGIVFRHVTR